jgi:hypothetical protein
VSKIGTFYRIFWVTGGSNDIDEATYLELKPSWEEYWRGNVGSKQGVVQFADVNGAAIDTHLCQIVSFHRSTPEVREAWHERDRVFSAEEQLDAGWP